ncbi:hypothetical protein DICPUDRAFT_34691 [Dictyostelium purpureum]|uniref:6-phosphogluconolactonase n=1 Tax=Dictyostelium purpureum TaxID=5786 RepID=F0ZN66_DICPU|nr:uncharacterized protein DICPUDRAFT_34691 [Dictyostelium purpureum]EGC34627.1 hypothetical protein DICPUDRAFT_34691 [Dictyostelium purpureum]|eukprot:XP_003288852.1 hypothetical protein DICPUDRAFT_34691 [Dictyostelium purpureum]
MDSKLINFIKVDGDKFEDKSIEFIKGIIKESINSRNIAVVGLSGGSTPKPIYEKLGNADESIQWEKVFFFSVDERYIEKASKDSIYDLISKSIFSNRKQLLDSNFVTPDTSLPLKDCIAKYEQDLKSLISKSGNAPDLVTLGMGEDGHIASIFPNASISPVDHKELVYHTTTERFAIFDRITTNINFLSSARNKVFFMSGANKKVVWDEMFGSQENINRWPAHLIIKSGNTNVIYRD